MGNCGDPTPSRPLEGARVIDMTHVLAGPYLAVILAALGAEVVKIERPGDRGLPYNPNGILAPHLPGTPDRPYNRSPWFNEVNRGKKSVTLNLRTPDGMRLLRELIGISDVLIHNFNPRVMEDFRLTYEDVRELNPSMIYVGITGFGSSGSRKYRNANSTVAEATSGLLYLTGYGKGEPRRPATSLADFNAASHAACATLGALWVRRRNGQGQRVDVSMSEALSATLADALMEYSCTGRVASAAGNTHAWMVPHGCYRCQTSDTWVTVAIRSDHEWEQLCRLLDWQEGITDERYNNLIGRWRHSQAIDKRMEEWTTRFPPGEAAARLQKVGIPAAPVNDAASFIEDPHVKARRLYGKFTHPEEGTRPAARLPMQFLDFDIAAMSPAPCFGQHNEEVLEGLLGVSPDAYERLLQEQVITDEPLESGRAKDPSRR